MEPALPLTESADPPEPTALVPALAEPGHAVVLAADAPELVRPEGRTEAAAEAGTEATTAFGAPATAALALAAPGIAAAAAPAVPDGAYRQTATAAPPTAHATSAGATTRRGANHREGAR
jgi:hypothetical protein